MSDVPDRDDKIRAIVDEAHADVKRLLGENRERLDALAEALMVEGQAAPEPAPQDPQPASA